MDSNVNNILVIAAAQSLNITDVVEEILQEELVSAPAQQDEHAANPGSEAMTKDGCVASTEAVTEGTPEAQGFRPRKGTVYHTGDFKTAVSRACRELHPRNEDESWDAWKERMDGTDFWKLGMELNDALMHGRDGMLRDRITVIQATIDAYGEDQPPTKEETFTLLLCQNFVRRANLILDQRQRDRQARRIKDVKRLFDDAGYFSLGARVHEKKQHESR